MMYLLYIIVLLLFWTNILLFLFLWRGEWGGVGHEHCEARNASQRHQYLATYLIMKVVKFLDHRFAESRH